MHRTTRMVIPMSAGAFLLIVFFVWFATLGPAGEDTTDAINRACRGHDGVSRVEDSGLVICRDGTAQDY